MKEKEYGYIAATFSEEDTKPFQKLIKVICGESDFCYSDTIGYIKGDVSSRLHLTLFYGLIGDNIDKNRLNDHLRKIKLPTLRLGELALKQESNNFCQILCIQVIDQDQDLATISESFKKFEYEKSVQLEFTPHLTLAYVNPEHKLRGSFNFPQRIRVQKIEYFNK